MKQGLSDSDHAALVARAYKFPKLELGLIDNTEMGALNPMSLAEVQNKTVTWEELQMLVVARNAARNAYHAHKRRDRLTADEEITFDIAENALLKASGETERVYQSALRRYQEQTK